MNKLLLRRLVRKALACISVTAIALTIVYIVPALADTLNIWDGNKDTASVQYDGGDGSEEAPFLISNGAQLYKMVSESSASTEKQYFMLTRDIYLNDVSKADWKSTANEWYTADNPDTYSFNGTVDGGGHTVFGLYVKSSFTPGLFPQLNAGAKIGNLTLSDADVSTGWGYAGAFAGRTAVNHSSNNVEILSCAVVNSRVSGNGWTLSSAAFVGLSTGSVSVENCLVRDSEVSHSASSDDAGAFVGDCYFPGTVTVKNSYSLDIFPVSPFKNGLAHASLYKCKNVYTNAEPITESHKAVTGIKKVLEDNIRGESATEILKGFDFEYSWKTTADFPELVRKSGGLSSYDSLAPGQVWSGKPAKEYAGGSGTEGDPYLISTAGQLAKLVKSSSEGETHKGEFFKLTHNIILNDTSYENWQEDANQWYTSSVGLSNGFGGHFDGNGKIISGMYIQREGGYIYAGLFPTVNVGSVIEKVGLVNSAVLLDINQYETVSGGIVGAVSAVEALPGEVGYAKISQCFADSTVTLHGYCAGAMVCYGAQYSRIDNCFFTGSWKVNSPRCGALLGYTWSYSSFSMENCYVAPQVAGATLGCSNFNTQSYNNCYTLAFQPDAGVVGLYYTSKMNGEAAKANMVGLDYDNVWITRENETPGLRVFEGNEISYSNSHDFDIIDDIHYVTISFVSYSDKEVSPIVGTMFESITLPKMPQRDGYKFLGWYTDATLMLEYPIDYIPAYDITLYAKWELLGIEQGFEDYPATEYDMDEDYEHYKMSVENFSSDYVRSGARSLHRIGNSSETADFLLFYENELQVGKVYKMTFWATTDENNATVEASIVHATWPDIGEPDAGVGRPFKMKLKKGEWKQYTCSFTAQSKWLSIRTGGGHSVFFDDFFLFTNGENGTLYNIKPVVDNKSENPNSQGKPDNGEPVIKPDKTPEIKPEESMTGNSSTEIENGTKKNTDAQEKTEENYTFLYVIIGVGAALVVASAVLLIISYKRKRVKKNEKV